MSLASHPAVPRVSVIVPCYAQGAFLREAVDSVAAQTFLAWEIVIVDDGSPDDTANVAREAIERHGSRIRLLQQANGGVARARNAGIAVSRGRYILPLDADDRLHPEMLESTVAVLDADPSVGVAYVDYHLFGSIERDVQVPEFDLDGLCRSNHITATALYRRAAWDAVGGYNPNMVWGHEDWDFWIGCAEHGFTPRRVPGLLFYYRSRVGTRGSLTREMRRAMAAQVRLNHPRLFTPWQRLRRYVMRVPRNVLRRAVRLSARMGKPLSWHEPW